MHQTFLGLGTIFWALVVILNEIEAVRDFRAEEGSAVIQIVTGSL